MSERGSDRGSERVGERGTDRGDVRQRILDAAATLLETQGRDAVTTRAVSAAAGVQPPTIYRLFTDMRGLLDAVTSSGFETYLRNKQDQALTDDPVRDLRTGWDLHVRFGLDHPAQYLLMYGQPAPDTARPPPSGPCSGCGCSSSASRRRAG